MTTLIAEDLLLLLLDDETGKLTGAAYLENGIGGALLIDERTAALIALLSALDLTHKVVDREGLTAKEIKKRAQQVAEGDWAAKAVRDSIEAAQAAVTAAVIASTAATTAASS